MELVFRDLLVIKEKEYENLIPDPSEINPAFTSELEDAIESNMMALVRLAMQEGQLHQAIETYKEAYGSLDAYLDLHRTEKTRILGWREILRERGVLSLLGCMMPRPVPKETEYVIPEDITENMIYRRLLKNVRAAAHNVVFLAGGLTTSYNVLEGKDSVQDVLDEQRTRGITLHDAPNQLTRIRVDASTYYALQEHDGLASLVEQRYEQAPLMGNL